VLYCIGRFTQNSNCDTYKAGTILMLGDKTASDKPDEIELHDVSMRLKPGEACYFEGLGFLYHSKEVVSGYKHRSYGHSMRMMKGFSTHSSSGRSDAIRETVSTVYQGRLFITNERIVFLAERYGFDIGFDNSISCQIFRCTISILKFFLEASFIGFIHHTAFSFET